jgi:trk system potassium uptake protein
MQINLNQGSLIQQSVFGFIYVGFTFAETFLLWVAGMGLFDAANHAMSTMATGGFSTKNTSAAYWNDNPLIQYIIIVFMFLAGTNFVMSYFAFKGRMQKVLHDDEFKWYAGLVAFYHNCRCSDLFSGRCKCFFY